MDLFAVLSSFVRVVETGSLSRTARESGLSHTAITRQIAQLEQHFGVRLLHRTTRRLSLTDDGRVLVDHARRLLAQSSTMVRELGAHRDAPAGLVRLGCVLGAGMFLARHLPELLHRHSGLTVELTVCDFLGEMVESRLDLALCRGDIGDSSFIVRQIGSFDNCIVAAPAYLGLHGVPETPTDLARHTCILQEGRDRSGFWHFDGSEGPVPVRVSGQLFTNNERAALVMARSGYGIACLPEVQLRDDVSAGRLVLLLEQYQPRPAMLYAVYPSRRQLAPRTRVVLEFLVQKGHAERNVTDWHTAARTEVAQSIPITLPPRAALGANLGAIMN